ncbi:mitochondrial mRNA pseudouridine synthase TRUB2 [Oncorhynchus tshawytscha]|uniref:Pseudouridine synthase II N-terminal domain-containing protein n=1 Tax=Oncorhynchus tshawytscha TaxID=74940 RepID=A0A8C8GUZ8_ONCTS|nr:mitochondrial mRNA pseudouridine synthase TRUB2 [Oncorhynchus tshawytscha]
MARPSVRVFHKLEGLFSIYKPPGVHWKLVRDTIETNLLKGINAAPPPAPRQRVQFLAESTSVVAEGSNELTLSAASVPALAHHPLVSGPDFQHIGVGVGHRLDVFSSGVLVLGVGQSNKALTDLYRSHVTRDYTLEGELGMATDNFSHTGRLIERTTYDHITRDKLERVLAMMQGSNQKALLTYSKVDMSTQGAYELAVKGELRPDGKSPPIMTGLRLLHFQPPHFTLEVQCLNETQRYLCRILHEVGLELRSTAVCKGVRRTRDGPFTIQHALTHQHWTSPDVIQAIRQYRSSRKASKAKHTQPGKDTGTASQRQEMAEEAAVTGDSHRLHSVLTSKAFGS